MRCLLLFVLSCFSLFAHFEHDPHALFDGHVNTLTGDFVAVVEDLVVDAIQPIPIRRFYESSTGIWNIVPQKQAIFRGEKGEMGKIQYTKLDLYEPNGSCLTYLIDQDPFTLQFPEGFANTARGEIGGRNHLINQTIEQIDSDTFHVITPEKTLRVYKKGPQTNRDQIFLLESEELPNGNFYLYSYDSFGRLEKIQGGNPSQTKTYAECTFKYLAPPKRSSDFNIETSDGQTLEYRFSLLKKSRKTGNQTFLTQVGETTYSYLDKDEGFRLENWENIPIFYDEEGRVIQYGETVIAYDEGKTEVDETAYLFNENNQLIARGDKTFEWSQKGNLLATETSRYTYDGFGNVILKNDVAMQYDTFNRLIERKDEKVDRYRYLGGTPLVIEETHGSEDKVWLRTQYAYNQDHLLIRKSIDDGDDFTFQKAFEVEGPPHQPFAILEKGGDALLGIRTYQYLGDTVLEETGERQRTLPYSPSKSLLDTIHLIGNNQQLDEEIPEGAYVERDFFDRITRMEVYDEKGTLLTSKKWEYNTFFLIAETDSEGWVTRYTYDEAGHKITKTIETEQGDQETLYSHDARGRLDRIQCGEVITRLQYDQENQVLNKWEEDLEGNLLAKHPEPLKDKIPPFPAHEGAHKRYDQLGRLIELYTEDGTIHYTITYNGRGEPITITDQVTQETNTRAYDALGNLIGETFLNGETVTSQFDLWGRRTEYTLPDNSKIYYFWGPKYLDEMARTTAKENFEYRHRFMNYNSYGLPEVQRLIEGFGQLAYDTDEEGTITGIHTRHFEQTEKAAAPLSEPSPPKNYPTTTDSLGRITSFTLDGVKIAFTYDLWNRPMTKRTYHLVEKEWTLSHELHFLYDDQVDIGAMRSKEDTHKLAQLRVVAPHPVNTGDHAIAYEIDQMPYVPLFDLEGNPHILLSVIRRKVMESYHYTPDGQEQIIDYWGDPLNSSKAANPWRFGCYRYDEDLGLYSIEGSFLEHPTQPVRP